MKNKIVVSSVVSIIINVLCCLINYLSACWNHIMPLSVAITGGDCVNHIGFGVDMLEIFPMIDNSQLSSATSNVYEISFHPLSFFVCLIAVFAIVFIISLLFKKKNV